MLDYKVINIEPYLIVCMLTGTAADFQMHQKIKWISGNVMNQI